MRGKVNQNAGFNFCIRHFAIKNIILEKHNHITPN